MSKNQIINLESEGRIKVIIYYLVVYLAMHGGIFFLADAVYWDDWTLYRMDRLDVIDTFRQQNFISIYVGHIHNIFMGIGLWLYKLVTFLAIFFTAVFLDLILRKFHYLDKNLRVCIVLLFLSLPFYWARVAMIDMIYTLCVFLFFSASYFYWTSRILSLILFFLSFTTNSLLVFYAIPFLSFYYLANKDAYLNVESLFRFSIKHIDFILLPFVFFAIKNLYFQPYGIFDGYNQHFGIQNLFTSAAKTLIDLFQLEARLINVLIAYLVIYKLVFKFKLFSLSSANSSKKTINLYYLGLFFLLMAVFPYWILGHVTKFSEWTSRHQLLMPLGTAFIFTGLIFATKLAYRRIIASLIFSICFVLNFSTYVSLYYDWKKQVQIIDQFRNNDVIKNSNVILISDATVKSNALDRVYRVYEWNGLMEAAFGDQKRIGMSYSEHDDFTKGRSFKGYSTDPEKYKMKDFSFSADRKYGCVSIYYKPKINSFESYFIYLKNGFPIEVKSMNCNI